MNFDYLQNLNIDFGNTDSTISPQIDQHELDLFTQAATNDFFSLDVFGNDHIPIKPKQQQQHNHKEEPVQLKQEPIDNQHFTEFQFTNITPPQQQDQFTIPPQQQQPQPQPPVVNKTAVVAAQEDKRKRNTAASARFRIKKKLKEQELIQRSKELEEKVSVLEKKLKSIEMENKILKSILLKEQEKKNDDLLETIKKRSLDDWHWSS
ncbi:Transcription factor zip1 [Candida viswanathii]|jgi:hypothetical protein|uniref:Transcription factor zip1 n=1 Tax=Candida viswanathii TaxID=5486 RepID=A0A367YHX9_9ASCO|nr:Transcription factor zip1 [Candida viswanathii]